MAEENDAPQWWREYLSADSLYPELHDLKIKGWETPDADKYFEARREKAINTSMQNKRSLFSMTQKIGRSLAACTNLLNQDTAFPYVLDLCMAPGGFSTTVKQELPRSTIDALTLPSSLGGYDVIAKKEIFRELVYADITMYSSEMGIDKQMLERHVDYNKFESSRPFLETQYDLIFCGGAVLKEQPKEEYRSDCEMSRLKSSQLVFALNRLKPGGSLVFLLYQSEGWHTACFIHALSKFSNIRFFKHKTIHAIKSSFYLVAKNVRSDQEEARRVICYWKAYWKYLTFKGFADVPRPISRYENIKNDEVLTREVQEFASGYMELARPVWEIQAAAMRRAPFNKPSD